MRIVQAGVGRWGIGWAASLRATPPYDLVAVADPTPAAREEAAARLGLAPERCFASLAEALTAVDAALQSSETGEVVEVGRVLEAAGRAAVHR